MKYLYLTFVFFIITFNSFSQKKAKMKITLNNGKIVSGTYKIKSRTMGFPSKIKITSIKGREKYSLDDIKNVIVYTKNSSIYLEVILTKKYLKSKTIEKKLAEIRLDGDRIKLYFVSEISYRNYNTFTTVSRYYKKYMKKEKDSVSYNIGYLYGAGQIGIKRRVRDYFTDCPQLIEKVENNKIPKKDTMLIALFYEQNCGN